MENINVNGHEHEKPNVGTEDEIRARVRVKDVPREGFPKGTKSEDLFDLEMPEIRWRVPGFLPEGLTVFSAPPKTGKSFCVHGVAIEVAKGGKAFGSVQVEQCEVLYLALEDNLRRLKKRMLTINKGVMVKGIHYFTEWERGELAVDMLERWLATHPKVGLVIIDTLQMIKPKEQRPGNIYAIDVNELSPFQKLAGKYQLSIWIVHHNNQGTHTDIINNVSGSSGITGTADTIMVMRRERGQTRAEMFITGRDIEEEQTVELELTRGTGQWVLTGTVKLDELGPERREIINLFKKDEWLTTKNIVTRYGKGKSEGTLRNLISRMAEDQFLEVKAGPGNSRIYRPKAILDQEELPF